jgi:hypothetical protein
MALRVTHCPVNFAGIPWQNVLRERLLVVHAPGNCVKKGTE